jgi:hypothetical protein
VLEGFPFLIDSVQGLAESNKQAVEFVVRQLRFHTYLPGFFEPSSAWQESFPSSYRCLQRGFELQPDLREPDGAEQGACIGRAIQC